MRSSGPTFPTCPASRTQWSKVTQPKEDHHFYLKFVPGFDAPVHHHTADHYGVVVKGTMTLPVDAGFFRLYGLQIQ